jgi:hypothetical protein
VRIGGDCLQDSPAVLVDQSFRPGRADVPQRGEVGDAPLAVGRIERQGALGAQLAPVARVRLPVAAYFRPVANSQMGDGTDQCEPLARVGVLHLQHRVAVVFGAEDDAEHLDRSRVGRLVGVEQGCGAVHTPKLAACEAASSVPSAAFSGLPPAGGSFTA